MVTYRISVMSKVKDPDIVATSSVMSLKDPVSYLRIQLPCRSNVCSHNQCFDATSFLQLQEQAPTWSCPICSKTVAFGSLAVDQYVKFHNSNLQIVLLTVSDTFKRSYETRQSPPSRSLLSQMAGGHTLIRQRRMDKRQVSSASNHTMRMTAMMIWLRSRILE